MTTWYIATDYNDRTSTQLWTAFLGDIAIGGALVGTSYALAEDGKPNFWVLLAGATSAFTGALIAPLVRYPGMGPPSYGL